MFWLRHLKTRGRPSVCWSLVSGVVPLYRRRSLTVIVDTSEYPQKHSIFGYSLDPGALEPRVARILDKIPDKVGCTLNSVAEFFVTELSRVKNEAEAEDEDEAEDEAEDDYEQMDNMSVDEEISQSVFYQEPKSRLSLAQLNKYVTSTS